MNKMNLRQKLIVVLLDMVVLAELAACMYWTHQFQESMTPIFLKTYLPIVFITLVIGKICIQKARNKISALQTSDAPPAKDNRYYLFG